MSKLNNHEFEIVYSQAEILLKTFPDYQFKTVTAVVIVLGWLLTAETAQIFIRAHGDITFPATTLAFSLLTVLEFIWLRAHSNRIHNCYLKLKELIVDMGISHQCIDLFKLDKRLYLTYFAVNFLMSLAVVVTVYLICN